MKKESKMDREREVKKGSMKHRDKDEKGERD